MLRRGRFLSGDHHEASGTKALSWWNPSGEEMSPEDWTNPSTRCLARILDGRAQESGIKVAARDETLLMILNAHDEAVEFTLPDSQNGKEWVRLLDTNVVDEDEDEEPAFPIGETYTVTGRSLLLFRLRTNRPKAAPAE